MAIYTVIPTVPKQTVDPNFQPVPIVHKQDEAERLILSHDARNLAYIVGDPPPKPSSIGITPFIFEPIVRFHPSELGYVTITMDSVAGLSLRRYSVAGQLVNEFKL
jgi:hypothetical protein